MKKFISLTLLMIAYLSSNAQIITPDKEEVFIVTCVERDGNELIDDEWPCKKIYISASQLRFGDDVFKIDSSGSLGDGKVFFSIGGDDVNKSVIEYQQIKNGVVYITYDGHTYTCLKKQNEEVDQIDAKPTFNGGDASLFALWVAENLQYPVSAKQHGISGKVIISFVITKTGDVANVEVVRGVHPELDAEAIRVVAASPKWTPGIVEGKAVNVSYTIPVQFELTSSK